MKDILFTEIAIGDFVLETKLKLIGMVIGFTEKRVRIINFMPTYESIRMLANLEEDNLHPRDIHLEEIEYIPFKKTFNPENLVVFFFNEPHCEGILPALTLSNYVYERYYDEQLEDVSPLYYHLPQKYIYEKHLLLEGKK
jgi:hypothetical protein